MTKVDEILTCLTDRAPLSLAESWDNVGLLLGDRDAAIDALVIALDPTPEAINFACERRAQLLLTHHPLFLKPPHRLVASDPVGALILRCVRQGINVIAMHTNLDNAEGGVGDALAAKLGLVHPRVLAPAHTGRLCKLVTFVPPNCADAVRDAMASAGAGTIGEYSHCSFAIAGLGTFLPSDQANPFIGKRGELEMTDELRLEMIVPEIRLSATLDALIASHPYEEVAYDVYPLEQAGAAWGCLKLGALVSPTTGEQFVERALEQLEAPSARVIGTLPVSVSEVAVCGGSGASFIEQVAYSSADVYVTGDIKHHDALAARTAGLCVVDVGHAVSERVATELLSEWIDTYKVERAHGNLTCHLHPVVPPWEEICQARAVSA